MTRTTSRSRSRLILAAVAVVSAVTLLTTPAAASNVDSDTLVLVPYKGQTFSLWRNGNLEQPAYFTTFRSYPGNFDGQAGTDLFLYNPGSGSDGVLHVTPNVGDFTYSFRPAPISGSYTTPIVGDFDGNAIDDIFWYNPGTAADNLWLFKADGSHISKNLVVNGNYKPVAINVDGDGDSDIVWFAPGRAADTIWRFGPGGVHTSKPITINGDYVLVPGHFGIRPEGSPQRRLMFWNKDGADSIWTFDTAGNHTSAPMPNIDGNAFRPIVGNFTDKDTDAVFFYRWGTDTERFISFNDDGSVNQLEAAPVKGFYDTTVGDFDGNGYQDIAWVLDGKATIWKFTAGSYTQSTVTTNTVNTNPATIANYLYPA